MGLNFFFTRLSVTPPSGLLAACDCAGRDRHGALGGDRPKRSATLALCAAGFLFVSLVVILVPRHPIPALLVVLCHSTELRCGDGAPRSSGTPPLARKTAPGFSGALVRVFVLPALASAWRTRPYLGVVQDMRLAPGTTPASPPPPTAIRCTQSKYAPPAPRRNLGLDAALLSQTQTSWPPGIPIRFAKWPTRPYQEYFRERFMSDLRAQPPPVFIDAVAPVAYGLVDRAPLDSRVPALASFIRNNYLLRGCRRRSNLRSSHRRRPPNRRTVVGDSRL